MYSPACVAGVYLIKVFNREALKLYPCPVYSCMYTVHCTVLHARCNLHTTRVNEIHHPLPLYICLLYGLYSMTFFLAFFIHVFKANFIINRYAAFMLVVAIKITKISEAFRNNK